MEQPDIPLRSEAQVSGSNNIEQQLRSLRSNVTMLLIAGCCLGAGATLFLYRQASIVSLQVTESKRAIVDYESNSWPRIRIFLGNLQGYAKTDPEFNKVLIKYGVGLTNASPAIPVPAQKK
jgi:hypothetical protein